ncbi:MAG: hypothetical protein QOI10_650 [Solirubrobacterales bacterium]|jgi:hypothetical protein|nr:hypothetical protein [Solirubrobacterales bacterium]
MTQGRKSRTVLAIVCALAALAAATVVPAYAGAQAADNEYNLTLPGASGGGQGDAGGGQTPSAGAPGASGADSSGGGAPIVLIGLAALAALCTGAAVWRLRDRSGDRSSKVGPGAPEAASETQ